MLCSRLVNAWQRTVQGSLPGAAGRAAACLAWLLLVGLVLVSGAGRARADEESATEESGKSRDEQFQALADEVKSLEKQSNVLKKVVQLVRPTVVHIEAEKTDTASLKHGRRSQIEEAGSGFIIQLGQNFYVITNCHVVRHAVPRDIKIRLADGREIHPLRVWLDPETDVAIMAIAATNLVASRLGNSDDIEIGDFVLAMGSPFGLSHSVTFGIISAESRHDLELGSDVKYQHFLQTDAAINPGNSGGPLINLRGEVIGMNTAIASSSGGNEGIGFTIPIKLVNVISHQLVEHGHVVRGRLGIGLDKAFGNSGTATPVGLQPPRGARINEIFPHGTAAAAKLEVGDIILNFDGVPVESHQHLINLVGPTEVGRDVPVTISRGGKRMNLVVRIGSETSSQAAPAK